MYRCMHYCSLPGNEEPRAIAILLARAPDCPREIPGAGYLLRAVRVSHRFGPHGSRWWLDTGCDTWVAQPVTQDDVEDRLQQRSATESGQTGGLSRGGRSNKIQMAWHAGRATACKRPAQTIPRDPKRWVCARDVAASINRFNSSVRGTSSYVMLLVSDVQAFSAVYNHSSRNNPASMESRKTPD